MGRKPVKPKHRLQLQLSQKTMDRLERLKETTDETSYASVIRRALEIYGAVINHPGEVWMRGADGSEAKLVLLEKPKETQT
jgi:hypothetical protein